MLLTPFTLYMKRFQLFLLIIFCCASGLLAQVNGNAPGNTNDHDKQVIAYFTNWDAFKGQNAGLPAEGVLNQLNLDYSQYTILNWSFLGVAQDGSLHSGDLRNKDIYQVGAVQQPGPMFWDDIYSSWDYWLLYGELEVLYYLPDNLDQTPGHSLYYVYNEYGYKGNGASGWVNTTTGQVGVYPLPVPKQNGAKGLLKLCQENNVKLMASIGGWSMCKHFPEMAANPTKRARFVADCEKLIDMGFDGIDIDWEYPNNPGMNIESYSAADYTNFAVLMEDIRAAIGPDKYLTAAMSASPANLGGFNWSRLATSMDYFNMMTYDYNGGWSNNAGHNSPLYGTDSWNSTYNFLISKGVAPSKINMGVGFYGRGVVTQGAAKLGGITNKTQANVQPDGPVSTCSDFTNWGAFDGTPYYFYIDQTINAANSGWTKYWDDVAKVPYATKGNFFLSYDNEQSIEQKANFVNDKNLAGVIIWEVFSDWKVGAVTQTYGSKLRYSPTTDAPLANKLNEVFANGVAPKQNQTITFAAIPNKVTTSNPFAITATASSGLPISFSIVSGPATISGNTITLTGLPGTVTVRAIQLGNNQYNPATSLNVAFSVTGPVTAPLSIGITAVTNVSCNGGNNGKLTAAATGGKTPYTYKWTNNQTAVTATNLVAGNFTITVTDALGVKSTATGTVSQPAALVTDFTLTPATIGSNNGAVDLAAGGGTTPYTYLWSNGATTPDLGNVGAGNYTVTVTDAKSCTKSATATVASINPGSGCVDPAWNVNTIYWENDKVSFNGNVYKANWWSQGYDPALNSGQWQVWTLIGACQGAQKTDQTIVFAPLTDKLTNSPAFNLSAIASSGLPVSFSIVSGPATISGNVVTVNGTAGTVVVRSSQAGNATYNAAPAVDRPFAVTMPAATLSVNIEIGTSISCNGGTNGSLTASAANGTTPYTYAWSNNATGATISNLGAGNYTVTVTAANGATATAVKSLNAPAALAPVLTMTNTTTGNSIGSASMSISGGTAPYYVAVNGGAQALSDGTYLRESLAPGNYTFVVTDTRGCSKSVTGTVATIAANPGCDEPAWSASEVYTDGNKVSFNGNLYRANWWTQGNNPAQNSGQWQVWTLLSPCTAGGNVAPQVAFLSPIGKVRFSTPGAITMTATATDVDGTIASVIFNINGQQLTGVASGNQYTVTWTPTAFGAYPLTITAKDNSNATTPVSTTIVVEQINVQSGDFIITQEEFNTIFPYRYGVNIQTGQIDPAKDFFSYENLKKAVDRMGDISCTFERRTGTNLYRVTRTNLVTGQQQVIRLDAEFNASYNVDKPIITKVVDYGSFVNEGDFQTRRREMAAFLANISQETTGGWPTAPGGQYAWGLYFREEVGYENNPGALGYRDEGNTNYPPAPGKSYHGRGPIQLSWNYNYGQVSEFLYGNKDTLLKTPEKVTQDGALAFQTAMWFWMTPQNPKPSAHDVMVGNWTPSCFDEDRNREAGFGMTVNIINGGLECGGGTENQKVVNRIGHYTRHSGILGVGRDLEGTNTCNACGCAGQQSFSGFEGEPEDCPGNRPASSEQRPQAVTPVMLAMPNPTNGAMDIHFTVEISGNVQIDVVDMQGRIIQQVVQEQLAAGQYNVRADISRMAPGVYLLRKTTASGQEVMKISKVN